MAKNTYTQTVEPVSRIPEKIFGWLGWILLFLLTAGLLFLTLVTFNDEEFQQELRTQVEQAFNEQEEEIQESLPEGETVTQNEVTNAIMDVLDSSWMGVLLLAIPLLTGLFGLLTMKNRIVSGILLLITAILTSPLFFLLIPIFFVVAAILLFVRKDKVITHDDHHDGRRYNDAPYDERRDYDRVEPHREDRVSDGEDLRRRDEVNARGRNDNHLNSTAGAAGVAGAKAAHHNHDKEYDSNEETRQFERIDESQYNEGQTFDNDRHVDNNLDSREPQGPVTEDSYDASRARRDNVERRNNDTL